ncbi:MAG TPA: futalosine hydrolase [Flavisolibacter sp.]|nr:futalosine hydrolase [Flavisolibacter sp.]
MNNSAGQEWFIPGKAKIFGRELIMVYFCGSMSLLVCAATDFEILPTLDMLRQQQPAGVDVLITGIGLTAATYSLTRSILQARPSLILQAGIAGSLDPLLPLGKVVAVRAETIGDLGVQEDGSFRSLSGLGLLHPNDPPWQEGKLFNPFVEAAGTGLHPVDAVSVNEISTNSERIEIYRALGASVESMEGAALHYVALKENLRFLQIRSISNYAGERDKKKWAMAEAITSLNTALQELILKFSRP